MRFLIASVCLVALVFGCDSTPPPPAAGAATGTVTMLIKNGDANPIKLEIEDVADGTTLESVMRSVADVPVQLSGSGQMAFVQSIDNIATDATRGWIFRVDDEFAHQGIGTTVLHPPTTVEWSFGEFEM